MWDLEANNLVINRGAKKCTKKNSIISKFKSKKVFRFETIEKNNIFSIKLEKKLTYGTMKKLEYLLIVSSNINTRFNFQNKFIIL